MQFQGQSLSLKSLGDGIVEVILDLRGESVNKFNRQAVDELKHALDILEASNDLRGVLLTSAKSAFVVGADITEFVAVFDEGPEGIKAHLAENNRNYSRLEDLPVPVVAAVNGYALGGGMELILACDYRILAEDARIGLPETRLGIIPGWGGTVRLPRIAGVDVAAEWIASGKDQRPDAALKAKVADAVVANDRLRDTALATLKSCIAGELDYQQRKAQKRAPLALNGTESLMAFETAKAFVGAEAGPHYPAPVTAIKSMQKGSTLVRDEAIAVEADYFARMAQTPVAQALVSLFLSDQYIGKKAKTLARQAAGDIGKAAVLGAGIMGGGIAYQSALKNVPIKMKDIQQDGLNVGLAEANKLLNKRVVRGRMSAYDMGQTLNRIEPCLRYDGFGQVDVVVEAVVENPSVKAAVLAEVEQHIAADAVLTSNTSTISISRLAQSLQRPENFCGMHFFNPVHAMPLVEVIRGEKSSEEAIAKTVAYALNLGKKVVVVNDCPGFLINRILFPYFAGFSMLVRDGADYELIDKVMERWGWPMGPAYLLDVVGLDTAVHCEGVLSEGYGERMQRDFTSSLQVLFDAGKLGQKNQHGFYHYQPDKRGKPERQSSPESLEQVSAVMSTQTEFDETTIIDRMMIPMATELFRCLEEGVVASPVEADMALIYGLGFPPFRGGLFHWIDSMGVDAFCEKVEQYSDLGLLYQVSDFMRSFIAKGNATYPQPATSAQQ